MLQSDSPVPSKKYLRFLKYGAAIVVVACVGVVLSSGTEKGHFGVSEQSLVRLSSSADSHRSLQNSKNAQKEALQAAQREYSVTDGLVHEALKKRQRLSKLQAAGTNGKVFETKNTNFDNANPGLWPLPGQELMSAGFDAMRWTSTYGKIFQFSYHSDAQPQDLMDAGNDAMWQVPDQIYAVGPFGMCKSAISASTKEYSSFSDVQTETASSEAAEFSVALGYEGFGASVSAEMGGAKSESKEATQQLQKSAGGYGKMERTETKAVMFKAALVKADSFTPTFIKDMEKLLEALNGPAGPEHREAAEKFMFYYGTHFVVQTKIGGTMIQDMYFQKKWTEEHSSSQMKEAAETEFNVGIEGSYNGFSGAASYGQNNAKSKSESSAESSALTEETSSESVVFTGGVPDGDYQAWCGSVYQRPALVDPNLAPIWHFLNASNLGVAAAELKPTAANLEAFKKIWARKYWCNDKGDAQEPKDGVVECTCDSKYSGKNCQFIEKMGEHEISCPEHRCSGNGKCLVAGGCVCNAPWRGEACDAETMQFKAGAAAAAKASKLGWFVFNSPSDISRGKKAGGAGGIEFDCSNNFEVGKTYRVAEVHAKSGSVVDYLAMKYEIQGGGSFMCGGGGGGGADERVVKLGEDEYIKSIRVRSGALLDHINFIDTNKKSSRIGGGTGGVQEFLQAPSGYKIIGFYGAVGDFVDSVGPLMIQG